MEEINILEHDSSKYFRAPDGTIRYAEIVKGKNKGHPGLAKKIIKEKGWDKIYEKIYYQYEVYGSILFLEYAGYILVDEGDSQGIGRQIQYCSYALGDDAKRYIENKKEEMLNDEEIREILRNKQLKEDYIVEGDLYDEDESGKTKPLVEEIVREIKLEIAKLDKRRDDDRR